MDLDHLEAAVRAQLTRVTANTLQSGVVSTGILNRATETILAAAREHAEWMAGEIITGRHEVIRQAVPAQTEGGRR